VTHLRFRSSLAAVALAGVATVVAACNRSGIDYTCSPVSNTQASVIADTVVTTTGLKYRDVTVGTGTQVLSTSDCQLVRVQYEVSIKDGDLVDATPDGSGVDVIVGFRQVISGFEQGLVGMRVGGVRELIVPPSLGYGANPVRGSDGEVIIPANSTLVILLTLTGLEVVE
jgi:FKBP-type peptidyl-prolyl cis-trans isomerase